MDSESAAKNGHVYADVLRRNRDTLESLAVHHDMMHLPFGVVFPRVTLLNTGYLEPDLLSEFPNLKTLLSKPQSSDAIVSNLPSCLLELALLFSANFTTASNRMMDHMCALTSLNLQFLGDADDLDIDRAIETIVQQNPDLRILMLRILGSGTTMTDRSLHAVATLQHLMHLRLSPSWSEFTMAGVEDKIRWISGQSKVTSCDFLIMIHGMKASDFDSLIDGLEVSERTPALTVVSNEDRPRTLLLSIKR